MISSLSFNAKNIFYGGVASWPCCDSSRWTVKGLSHTYTCIHSPPNLVGGSSMFMQQNEHHSFPCLAYASHLESTSQFIKYILPWAHWVTPFGSMWSHQQGMAVEDEPGHENPVGPSPHCPPPLRGAPSSFCALDGASSQGSPWTQRSTESSLGIIEIGMSCRGLLGVGGSLLGSADHG